MPKLILVCLKLIILCFVGIVAVKLWEIFVVIWVHGGQYQWGWGDIKFVVVNGSLLAAVFCVFSTIHYMRNRP